MPFDWRDVLSPPPEPTKKPGTSTADRVRLGAGALGNALSRSDGPNPVIAVLQQRAADEERERLAQQERARLALLAQKINPR